MRGTIVIALLSCSTLQGVVHKILLYPKDQYGQKINAIAWDNQGQMLGAMNVTNNSFKIELDSKDKEVYNQLKQAIEAYREKNIKPKPADLSNQQITMK